MLKEKLLLSICVCVFLISSCAQKNEVNNSEKAGIMEEKASKSKYDKQHPYGGWYCPG